MSDYFTQIADAVSFGADRPGKADLVAGRHLFVGLNCFEPGQRQRVHTHAGADKFYLIVSGRAHMTVGDETRLLQENESTYIPAGTAHRLANPGKVPLHLIEVQCGPYLGEDDIVRIDDEYGRS